MRRSAVLIATMLASSCLGAVVAEAEPAQPRRYQSITVKPRSFLDPGVVVPVGSMSRYVAASQTLNVRPNIAGPEQESPLPQRPWDVPGRPFSPPAALVP